MKKALVVLTLLMQLLSNFATAQTAFNGKPIYTVLTKRNNDTLGTFVLELFPNIAPKHVRNFDSLVSVQFFDSTAFHRVIPGFMIQGGDPNSRHGNISTWGYGDPNQPNVDAEFSAAKHLRGTLSAARDNDTNSANSQFFVCVAPATWLNGDYSVYGQVTSGMNYVDTIVSAPRDANDNPLQKIEMFITYTGINNAVPSQPTLNTPVSGTAGVGTAKSLKWNSVPGAIIYELEVSTDSLFSTFHRIIKVGAPAVAVSVNGLVSATKYYWRVKANNGGFFSTYSDVWNFSTVGGVGISNEPGSKPDIYVYPNPSAGKFLITNMEKEVMIEVFDFSGKLILKKEVTASDPTLDLSMRDCGAYLYRIVHLNGEITSGKLIIE